jgi:hypothetical protein
MSHQGNNGGIFFSLLFSFACSEAVRTPALSSSTNNNQPMADAGQNMTGDAGMAGANPDASPSTMVTEFGPCVAPSNLTTDPLVLSQSLNVKNHRLGTRTIHLYDSDVDPRTGNVFMVGTGGLYAFTKQGDQYDAVGVINQPRTFDKLEIFGDTYLALSVRDRGLYIVDARDPSNLVLGQEFSVSNPNGAAATDTHLFVTSMSGSLFVFDISAPTNIQQVASLDGLANPWEIVIQGTRAYIADNTLGVVVIDISNPSSPRIENIVATQGGAQDLTLQEGALYVAVGGTGIEVFDLSQPAAPASHKVIPYGSPVVSISSNGGFIWAVNHEDVIVLAIENDPLNPLPMAKQKTSEWALGVANLGATGFVANWTYFESYELDAQARAPEIDISRSEIYFDADATSAVVDIANRGSVSMNIVGASIDDPRFTFSADRNTVMPGEAAAFTLNFENDGQTVDSTLCIATDDPDSPVQEVLLRSTEGALGFAVGAPSINFVLPDVNTGVSYELAAQLGKPVVLIYFATW